MAVEFINCIPRHRTHKEVEFFYSGLQREQGEQRRVEPYHFLVRDGIWYVSAYDPARGATRRFLPLRMQEVRATGSFFEMGERHTNPEERLRHSIGVFGGDKPERIRLRLTPMGARLFSERIYHPSQQITPTGDGGHEMTMTVYINPELERMLMSYCREVTVLEPESLRQQLLENARQMLAGAERTRVNVWPRRPKRWRASPGVWRPLVRICTWTPKHWPKNPEHRSRSAKHCRRPAIVCGNPANDCAFLRSVPLLLRTIGATAIVCTQDGIVWPQTPKLWPLGPNDSPPGANDCGKGANDCPFHGIDCRRRANVCGSSAIVCRISAMLRRKRAGASKQMANASVSEAKRSYPECKWTVWSTGH